ncbi:hypothetical protein C2G38_2181890 [Gigaspora rosea]|uniref:Uncharacterized protein n=1 Tax=Gigaspora rosea TaxID=44941 RepID=A0A397VDL6_9GLOM|nr:hypothetical protein C2G38_2181890 [Gigaspora rosea]
MVGSFGILILLAVVKERLCNKIGPDFGWDVHRLERSYRDVEDIDGTYLDETFLWQLREHDSEKIRGHKSGHSSTKELWIGYL